MANTKSAKKAHRSSLRKKNFNVFRKLQIKNAMKSLRLSITNGNDLQKTVSKAFSVLDKAAKVNAIPKGRVDRKKSRISKLISKLSS
jgi:small subunit ribosomal protein S20